METYEFTEDQNTVIKAMSNRIVLLSIVVLVGGISIVMGTLLEELSFWLYATGMLYIFLALVLYLPSDNFKKIVTTEGTDIKELGRAFREFGNGMILVNIFTALNVIAYIMIWID
ncbi:MAG: hypothetical protein ACXAD7_22320 [Candidatus Kariarchaeaceae archaeon]|jgi:hypothetical protein